jgi:SAM-dependent methyltransferase
MTVHPLLATFMSAYPAQPATAFWRAIEIGALVRRGLPAGVGLDLGCGDGKLTEILLNLVGARQMIGIDVDPLETDAARSFAFYDRVHTCSATAIPEPSETVDFVLSNSVLEHIPDLEGTIAETARLLKRQGRFVFTVPGPAFHDNLAGSVLGHITRSDYLAKLDRRLAHFHYLSKSDWIELLGRHGLVLDECLGYLDGAETKRWETLSRMTGGLLFSVMGESKRPIEIQRTFGARELQNKSRVPDVVANALANLVSIGLSEQRSDQTWVDPSRASCLLLEGHRA